MLAQNTTKLVLAAVAALLAAPGSTGQDQGLELVKGAASEYVIMRPADSSPSQVYAAEELQAFTKQMTGAELPIVTDDRALPAKAVLLGWTRHSEGVLGEASDVAALGDDGFTLRTCGQHLLVIGSGVRGTLYGVYELLERYGGCRWYASFRSVIPRKASWSVPALNETQTPAFVMREPFWWVMFEGDFAARCKANGNRMELTEKHGGKISFGGGLFVHTFFRLMPPDEFFASHPEYYSEIGGQRKPDHTQLCLTNPDVVRIMTERVLDRIRQDPDAKLFSVSQNDWRGYCTCAECRAIDEREGSPSGALIHFVNQIAEAVEKEFPDAWIETLAYQYTRTPPKTLRPRRNVVPRLCSIECDFSLPLDVSPYPQNVKFVEDIKGWSAITDKLYIWDYTTNFGHYIGPHPNFGCLQGNVKFFRDNSVVGLFEQGAYQSPHAEFAELRAWVLAKLLWDPDQDVKALYDDFFPGYYGAAAKPVRAYFDELQSLAASPEHMLRIWSPMTSPWYTDEFLERAAALWAGAESRVADDPACLYNVRMGAISVMYARLQRWPRMATGHEWRDGALRPKGVDPGYAEIARELLARIEEGKITHVAESRDRHHAFLSVLKARTEGFTPVMIRSGGLVAGVVPDLGGRVCSLNLDDGPNVLHPTAGGIGFSDGPGAFTGADAAAYGVAKAEAASVVLGRTVRNRYHVERVASVSGEGLTVTNRLTSSRADEQTIRPAMQVALDLGDAASICARIEGGSWVTVPVPAEQAFATASVPVPQSMSRTLLVASAKTGRGARVRLPDGPVERVLLHCDAVTGSARVVAALSRTALPGKGTAEATVHVLPLAQVTDLPSMPPSPAGGHGRAKVVVEEFMITLGHPGSWGEIVQDPAAGDGFASKLFNTHFEWCMQWRFDPVVFEPGAQYRLRMRVRVEKSDREGEAFWAGVYDTARKRGHGQVSPKTTDVGEGYQWYEVATWVPEASQYVWVGPGRFDKQGGQPSAIKAVYVDKYELTKVE